LAAKELHSCILQEECQTTLAVPRLSLLISRDLGIPKNTRAALPKSSIRSKPARDSLSLEICFAGGICERALGPSFKGTGRPTPVGLENFWPLDYLESARIYGEREA
jgi:hypothetical protein